MRSLAFPILAVFVLAIGACSADIGGGEGTGDGECGYGDFVCGDGACIPRAEACNGTESCSDGSDEDDCAAQCERSQYRCRDGTTCIAQSSLCDEREDCPGGDDEATCGNAACAGGFECPDGTCLPAEAKCNGMQECAGGEDEKAETCAPARCPNRDDLRCEDGATCVPKARQCDGVPHCPSGEDEGAEACAGGGTPPSDGGKEGEGSGKPNGGGDGPDKPGGGGSGRPCGDVPDEGRCGKSDVLEFCDKGRLERQSCRRQGMVCGRDTDGDPACVAPAGTPPATCEGVDATGSCQGDTLVFCVSGKIRTQDCSRSGKTCSTAGEVSSCVLGEADACADIDATGECDGNTMVWCDATGARKTYDCASSGMTCGAKAGGELAIGCNEAPCGGIDYRGECDGDVLHYCSNNSVLVEMDCRGELGLGCGLQNETVGYNCQGTAGGGSCGDVTFAGTCQGDKVVWCSGSSVDVYDCATQGMTCGDAGDSGNWCVPKGGATNACGTITYEGTCQGDVAMWCANGQLRSKDCGDVDQGCGFISPSVGYYCSSDAGGAADELTCADRCIAGPIAGATPACFCDNLCVANGDCCGGVDSYQDVCPSAPLPDTASCEGHCGELTPVPGATPACYCDDNCTVNGDCCGDYAEVCSITV